MGSFTRKATKVNCCEAKWAEDTCFYFFTTHCNQPTNNKSSHPVPIITDLFVPCVHILLHPYTSSQCFFWNIYLWDCQYDAYLCQARTPLYGPTSWVVADQVRSVYWNWKLRNHYAIFTMYVLKAEHLKTWTDSNLFGPNFSFLSNPGFFFKL